MLFERRCASPRIEKQEKQHRNVPDRVRGHAKNFDCRDGGRGGRGQFELESHSQVESLVRHVLVRALWVCRTRVIACDCVSVGVHLWCPVLRVERCAKSPHTSLSQRALSKGETPPIT